MSRRKVMIVDATLRDGCHPIAHQFGRETIARLAALLDRAGVPLFEVTHGDGLGGSSVHFGRSLLDDSEAIAIAKQAARQARVAAIFLPGIGTIRHLEQAARSGLDTVRVATQCTEADLAPRYIRAARQLGLAAMGFLILSSVLPGRELAEQAARLEEAGAEAVYVVDSAGTMLMDDVRRKVALLKERLSIPVGFHGHNNLGLAVGNSLAAVEEGAELVDGCLAGFGAGAGNAPTEVLAAALSRMNLDTGTDLPLLMAAADLVRDTVMPRPQILDTPSLSLGYRGVGSSLLLSTLPLVGKYGLDAGELLRDLGLGRAEAGREEELAFSKIAEMADSGKPYASGGTTPAPVNKFH